MQFFISLYFFLFGLYGHVAPHDYLYRGVDALKDNFKCSENVIVNTVSNNETLWITFAHPFAEKSTFDLLDKDEENREEEVTSLKNPLEISKYFAPLFYNHLWKYLFQNIKNCSYKQIPYSSSPLYITFRVFRI